MPDPLSLESDFLKQLAGIVDEHISDEQFGVSDLAQKVGMSRSNLLRKVKKQTNLSVSQFIRTLRLESAMELLKQKKLNVSEVSYATGFGSTSYFIKCFHDHFGYPPGEVGKQKPKNLLENDIQEITNNKNKQRIIWLLLGALLIFLSVFIYPKVFNKSNDTPKPELEKSIAVLPFKNDSDDETNVYVINGLMESILNNLQKIEDLRVISRTSVEKYRNHSMTIPEIGSELNVNYFIEGSGQKIGDKIQLSIQLIEGPSDKHLWSKQYQSETLDIFKLQQEVAKNIAHEIHAIITPEEEALIDKVSTNDPVAYDYFLKGLDKFFQGTNEGLEEAINNFKKAIDHDENFARAHADVAISYYYLDFPKAEKKYVEEIENYAEKAMLLDPELAQSLISKALYYMSISENDKALPYFEKALDLNPNSSMVLTYLSEFYTNHDPNTSKYLEYALRGMQIGNVPEDSTAASFSYMHVSNAFVQSGFVNEAEKYINKSIELYPDNIYSAYVKAYVLYAKHGNLQNIKEDLLSVLEKDSTRLDVLQEVGKICYFMRDYESAYEYYRKFVAARETYKLDIYKVEDSKIGIVMAEMGFLEKSNLYLNSFLKFVENDQSLYRDLNFAMYYSYNGEVEKAIEYLKSFTKQENYFIWTHLFLPLDPLVDKIKDHPEFKEILEQIELKFWKNNEQLKISLEEKGLI